MKLQSTTTGRADFSLRISEFDNFIEQKISSLKCMDDLSQILSFLLL
jgi:hypothetical protein